MPARTKISSAMVSPKLLTGTSIFAFAGTGSRPQIVPQDLGEGVEGLLVYCLSGPAIANTPMPDQAVMHWCTQLIYPHVVHVDPLTSTETTPWGNDYGSSANVMKSSSSASFEPLYVNEDWPTGSVSSPVDPEPTATQPRGSIAISEYVQPYRSVTRCRLEHTADAVTEWLLNTSSEYYRDELTEHIAGAWNLIEVERWLEALRHAGDTALVDRLTYLRSPIEDDDEDDILLTDAAILGFKNFWSVAKPNEAKLSVTSTNGWLCTDWTYDDGRSLVLWFKDRNETMVTAFSRERQIIKSIGGDPNAANLNGAAQILIEANFFSWRHEPTF